MYRKLFCEEKGLGLVIWGECIDDHEGYYKCTRKVTL